MNELIKKENYLPDTINDLKDYILIGNEKLKMYQAKIRAIDKVGLAKEVRDQTVKEGQKVGGAILWAEAKWGDLLHDQTSRGGSMDGKRGSQKSLPEGTTHKQSHQAQQISENREIIKEVIKEAEIKEDVPTRGAVLKKIKEQKRAERKQEVIKQAKDYKEIDDIKIINDDFRNVNIADNSIDLILTDPPYAKEYINFRN